MDLKNFNIEYGDYSDHYYMNSYINTLTIWDSTNYPNIKNLNNEPKKLI